MNEEIFLNNLCNIFNKEDIRTELEYKEKYRNDWSTDFDSNPIAIVFPKESDQLANVIKLCNEFNYTKINTQQTTKIEFSTKIQATHGCK